jgi:hypothetical protein
VDSKDLDTSLLPTYRRERDEIGEHYTLLNFVATHGTVEFAVAFSKLFWPDFVERRGCIILADGFTEEGFEQWWVALDADVMRIEMMMNHTHLGDVFLNASDLDTIDEQVIDYLGHLLVDMWTARVGSLFPDRQFVVEYMWDLGDWPTIYLYQKSQMG